MRLPWLPEVLRGAGLSVIEYGGWRGRGRELASVGGVVLHHTATTPAWADASVATLLRDGRPDLSGPLAQLGLDRLGRYHVVTDGRAHHNGYGTWGNNSIGIEAFHSGSTSERWSPAQLRSFIVGTAAILGRLGYREDRARGHRETDPARKVDPTGIDLHQFRRSIPTAVVTTGGTFVSISPEDERKIVAMADVFLSGAPDYGVPPVAGTVSRIDRNVAEVGKSLGHRLDGGELKPPTQQVIELLRNVANLGLPEVRRNLRRADERLGVEGVEGAADPPQQPLMADDSIEALARAVADHLPPGSAGGAAVDIDDLAAAIVAHYVAALSGEEARPSLRSRLARRIAG